MTLAASSLNIEGLALAGEGQISHIWACGKPTSIHFAFRVNRTSRRQAVGSLDFTADITARNKLGDNQCWPLGTVQRTVRIDEPFSVELVGPPLPRGLYRLEASVLVYTTDHAPDAQPLQGRRASGALIQVA